MTAFIVSADHIAAAYRVDAVRFPVGEYVQGHGIMLGHGPAHPEFDIPETFYASYGLFGCGKDARTPQAAIRMLLEDNGCFNIRITEELPARTTEQLKVAGEYRRAGQEARLEGRTRYYGCHFGMRSTLAQAVDEFREGWDEIDVALGVSRSADDRCNADGTGYAWDA